MATNEATIECMTAIKELVNEVINVRKEHLPTNISAKLDDIEERYAKHGTIRGIKNTFALHIGQQSRQIAWFQDANGKWGRKTPCQGNLRPRK